MLTPLREHVRHKSHGSRCVNSTLGAMLTALREHVRHESLGGRCVNRMSRLPIAATGLHRCSYTCLTCPPKCGGHGTQSKTACGFDTPAERPEPKAVSEPADPGIVAPAATAKYASRN